MRRPLAISLALAVIALSHTHDLRASTACLMDCVSSCVMETGGFPPSNPGDTLDAYSITQPCGPLSSDPGRFEYTIHLGELLSEGQEQPDPHNITVSYLGGILAVYEDARHGGTPADCTDPTTFVDGSEYLTGDLSFQIFYNMQFNTGAVEGMIHFTGGDHLWELGGNTAASLGGGLFIFGDQLMIDGQILLLTVPVTPGTWGRIKASYR